MPMDHGDDLMQSLTAKLYSILTGDDDSITIPRNKFVSWFLPGVPFDAVDFRYCAKGFNGATTDEIRENYHQAFVLSKLFDFVPDVGGEFIDDELQQVLFASNQDSISSVYSDVLKFSRVVHKELTEKQQQKIQKFRDLMSVTVEEKDIITDEVKQVSKPGKLTIAYNLKMQEYTAAADELMNLQIDALAATGNDAESKRRVHAWARKEKFLRKNVDAAMMAWVAQGFKNEYEEISAFIDQVTRQSLVLYKQDLVRKLESSVLTDDNSQFHYTTLLPGSFATNAGWPRFTFSEMDFEKHHKKTSSKARGGGGVRLGLFSVGGGGGTRTTRVSDDQKLKNFTASFEFTQVPICRPWFEPGFFSMRSWDLDEKWDLSFDKKVSDGAEEPVGRLVAYPTSAVFVRDVKLTSSSWARQASSIKKNASGGGRVGWGPFHIGGSASKGSEEKNTKIHIEGDTLTIEGIQLIATINNIIPKSPNLHPDIKEEDLT